MPKQDDDTQQLAEELYLKVKQLLFETYEPAVDPQRALRLSTIEIYDRLREHIPGAEFSLAEVSSWMIEGGFKTDAAGSMKLSWLMQKRRPQTTV